MIFSTDPSNAIFILPELVVDTHLCDRAYNLPWYTWSFENQVALTLAFLRLQQSNQLPPQVTVNDLVDQIEELEKVFLRVQLWQLALEDCGGHDLAMLDLLLRITANPRFDDVELEARRVLHAFDRAYGDAPSAEADARGLYSRGVLEERLSRIATEVVRLFTDILADAFRRDWALQPDLDEMEEAPSEDEDSGLEEDGGSDEGDSEAYDSDDSGCPPVSDYSMDTDSEDVDDISLYLLACRAGPQFLFPLCPEPDDGQPL